MRLLLDERNRMVKTFDELGLIYVDEEAEGLNERYRLLEYVVKNPNSIKEDEEFKVEFFGRWFLGMAIIFYNTLCGFDYENLLEFHGRAVGKWIDDIAIIGYLRMVEVDGKRVIFPTEKMLLQQNVPLKPKGEKE